MSKKRNVRRLVILFFVLGVLLCSFYVVFALTTNLATTACATCDNALITGDDTSYETLDKNEDWTIDYGDLNCDTFTSGTIYIDIWAQDPVASETVTLECDVGGATWDKCGTNTLTPTGSEARYSYSLSGVDCTNIISFQMRLTSNDAAAPDDFYVDYTYVYVDYAPQWNSYSSTGCSLQNDAFSHPATIYLCGKDFEISTSYVVAIYDAGDDLVSSESFTSDFSGQLENTGYATVGDETPGNWHSQVFPSGYTPPSTYTPSDSNEVAEDLSGGTYAFSVSGTPEFGYAAIPLIMSGMVYLWIRRRFSRKHTPGLT